MVAGFAEVIQREKTLLAAACNRPYLKGTGIDVQGGQAEHMPTLST